MFIDLFNKYIKSIHCIDDDDTTPFILAYKLEELGFRGAFTHSLSIEDGATFLSKTKIDLLLLDINFPGLNGLDFINGMVDEEVSYKIIIISSSQRQEEKTEFMNNDLVLGFLKKPVGLEEFRIKIEKFWNHEP